MGEQTAAAATIDREHRKNAARVWAEGPDRSTAPDRIVSEPPLPYDLASPPKDIQIVVTNEDGRIQTHIWRPGSVQIKAS